MDHNDLVKILQEQSKQLENAVPYYPEKENSEQIKRIADEFERLNNKIGELEERVKAEKSRATKIEIRNFRLSLLFTLLVALLQFALQMYFG